jgi:hypothetical protein
VHRCRSVRPLLALTSVCLGSGCMSVEIDETDRDAIFLEGRVRKTLDGTDDPSGPQVELGWNSVQGETEALDYSIRIATLGAGTGILVGEQGWFGLAAGIAWQMNDLDPSAVELEADDDLGPYFALEGGWRATSWLEPCARADATVYLNEYASTTGFEAGVRLHVIEHTALFLGWRWAQYKIDDVDSLLGISEFELDASGLIVGLDVHF